MRLILVLGFLTVFSGAVRAQDYVPPAGAWEHRAPAAVGMNAARLEAAIALAREAESTAPRDLLEAHYRTFAREPFGEAIGPFKERGPQTGIVIRHGYIVAEWGEPERVDLTFSVAKSFLSTVVGLAWADGLIRDIDDPVGPYLPPLLLPPGDGEPGMESGTGFGARRPVYLFSSEHNRLITWNHMLRQVSDWEGTLWGKPDWSDRPASDPDAWRGADRPPPGTRYEYNDTRVNLLALAATLVHRRPLQQVLLDRVMRPIGASGTWQWHGYENSWILLDGLNVQVPSGGSHWGGGMFINAYDQARFGLLTLRRYRWGDREILPEAWWERATTPTESESGYGFMNFFLNADLQRLPSAPASAWVHIGAGTNMIYCDPENDLVVVARWIEGAAMDAFVAGVLAALE
ncbi:MAG: serine hydrolase [Rhodothermales bacterium]